jgi:hypothetical protein
VVRLIAPINGTLTGIINSGDTQLFATTDGATWTTNGEVPEDFPVNNISAVNYKNNIGVENVLAVGRMANPTATDTATVAWGYMSGQQWVELSTESKYKCPLLETPTIIYYGGTIYTLGKDFTTFYYSVAGLVWKSVDSLFMLPEQLRGVESDYSMVVDDDNYIWIMRSSPNEVWRGRLNRLGFLVQE